MLKIFFTSILYCWVGIALAYDCETQSCVAVVDAGSSGSRLHIYSYQYKGGTFPIITEEWNKKIVPGLSSLTASPAIINDYLTHLFEGTSNTKPIPLYFYATAGMRMLSQPQQESMYSLITEWFASQSQWNLLEAKTIVGKDEGLYAWLSINYQLKTINTPEPPVGIFDIGGASTQIAFPLNSTKNINGADLYDFTLYGQHYSLFVHSFLGLGQNEASHQFLTEANCFIKNYKIPDDSLANGDAYRCTNALKSLINVHQVQQTVQTAITQNSNPQWYALGGIYETTTHEPLSFPDYHFTGQALLDQANASVCKQDWSALSSQYSSNPFLYQYCLLPAYYYTLLVEGYGLSSNQEITLPQNLTADWTLGVLLQKSAGFQPA